MTGLTLSVGEELSRSFEPCLKIAMRRKPFMSKVVVLTNLTLDGVMQGPAGPDEDRRGGFEHGGRGRPPAPMEAPGHYFCTSHGLLFGPPTHEQLITALPQST